MVPSPFSKQVSHLTFCFNSSSPFSSQKPDDSLTSKFSFRQNSFPHILSGIKTHLANLQDFIPPKPFLLCSRSFSGQTGMRSTHGNFCSCFLKPFLCLIKLFFQMVNIIPRVLWAEEITDPSI